MAGPLLGGAALSSLGYVAPWVVGVAIAAVYIVYPLGELRRGEDSNAVEY